jgi:hypothetical protein
MPRATLTLDWNRSTGLLFALWHSVYAGASIRAELAAYLSGSTDLLLHGARLLALDAPVAVPLLFLLRLFGIGLQEGDPSSVVLTDVILLVAGTCYWFAIGFFLARVLRLLASGQPPLFSARRIFVTLFGFAYAALLLQAVSLVGGELIATRVYRLGVALGLIAILPCLIIATILCRRRAKESL